MKYFRISNKHHVPMVRIGAYEHQLRMGFRHGKPFVELQWGLSVWGFGF